jgi:serine-type D-Ala-D-Ala carboxypeptidase/endopeptidase (penicillin-binding protein 4)
MGLQRRVGSVAGAIALLMACAIPAYAQTEAASPLAATIGTLLADPRVEGAHWGISLTQLDGTPIYALHDDQLFQPASNVKLFTTAAALGLLDRNATWSTYAEFYGSLGENSSATGNISLYGLGDAFLSDNPVHYVAHAPHPPPPTLTRLDELASDLAAKLAKAGVTTIDGGIMAEDNWQPYAEGWNNDDLVWGYGAPVSNIIINDNQLQLTITAGLAAGDAAGLSLAPDFPYYTVENHVVTAPAKTPTYIDVVPEGRILRIYGVIATDTKADAEQVAIDDPPLYAALAFKALLVQHGITVSGDATAQHRFFDGDNRSTRAIIREPIDLLAPLPQGIGDNVACETPCKKVRVGATHVSPSLIDDVTITNKESQNLHAELLLHKLAMHWQLLNGASFAQGARVVRQFAINAGVQPDDFYFTDGSGLSTYDLATPRAFTQLLRYAATQPWGAEYKASLPIGGVDGTLETRFTKAPLKGNVFAKTGTHSEGNALSGYLVCASGKTVVFSILVGDHLPGSIANRDVMDKIVAAIAAAN